MNRIKIRIGLFLLILALSVLFFSGSVFAEQENRGLSLFTDLVELTALEQRNILESKSPEASPRPDIVKRMARVELNDALAIPGKIKAGDRLSVDLFDLSLELLVDKTSAALRGTTTRARVEDCPYSFLIFSAYDGLMLGIIELPLMNRQYRVIYDKTEQSYFLYKIHLDEGDWLEGGPPLISAEEDTHKVRRDYIPAGDPLEEAEIDVLIAYTPAAREWAERNEGNIHLVMFQAMERGQLALDNSEVFITLRVVGFREVDYTETWSGWDTEQDLLNLRNGEEEHNMHLVHQWREFYGADLVALLARIEDYGGMARGLRNAQGDPDRCFSITRVQQAADSYTFIHELGHNMGAGHHKEQNVQSGPQLFDYSAGWRWFAGWQNPVCSIMTYENGKYFEDGRTHTTVAHFSNPDVLHNGWWVTGCTEDADNARTLRETKHLIAAYRPTSEVPDCFVMPPQKPEGPVTGNPETEYIYSAIGGKCILHSGSDVEYRFTYWGSSHDDLTEWSSSNQASFVFPDPDYYSIQVMSRCTSTQQESFPSEILSVRIFPFCNVPAPSEPAGFASGQTGTSYLYYTGEVECVCGAEVEYRFDWDDGSISEWSSLLYATHYWSDPGVYAVRAQARCTSDLPSESGWSSAFYVNITQSACQVLGSPDKPSGPAEAETHTQYTYTTGGALCNAGHEVDYTIFWRKEGEEVYQAPWSSSAGADIEFLSPGTHYVWARARCSQSINTQSFYSDTLTVTVTGPPCSVSVPDQPSGPTGCLSGPSYRYTTSGAHCACGSKVEYQFRREHIDSTKIYIFGWSHRTNIDVSFDELGTYHLYAEARCTYDNSVTSTLSLPLEVQVMDECHVSVPNPPSGPTEGYVDIEYIYTVGGSACINNHPVEYALLIGKDDEYYGGTEMCPTGVFPLIFSEPGVYWLIAAARCSESYSALALNIDEYLEVTITERDPADLFDGGDGTEGDPFQIANAEQLNNIRYYPGEAGNHLYFLQVANIDLADYGATFDEGKGWEPIGSEGTESRFTSNYNGAGRTISGLFINRPEEDFMGLFGYINDASINNVVLVDVNVTGKNYTGGLAGLSIGSIISRSRAAGIVVGSERVGGLVGENFAGSTIISSDTCGVVKGDSYAGGLTGWNEEGSSISTSYSTSAVSGNSLFGGLSGWNEGSIINSYASGDVAGITDQSDGIGGLVGMNRNEGLILNSYSAGEVKSLEVIPGTNGIGGFAGWNIGNITGCYYDKETAGWHDLEKGEPWTTAEMKQVDTFEAWDFTETWAILEDITYPYLQREMTGEEYSSRLNSCRVSKVIYKDEHDMLFITLRNTGTEIWNPENEVLLGAVGDFYPLSEDIRFVLQHDVLPGQLHTFSIPVHPQNSGIFTVEWQMLVEGEFWFGEVFRTTIKVEVRTDVQSALWHLFE